MRDAAFLGLCVFGCGVLLLVGGWKLVIGAIVLGAILGPLVGWLLK